MVLHDLSNSSFLQITLQSSDQSQQSDCLQRLLNDYYSHKYDIILHIFVYYIGNNCISEHTTELTLSDYNILSF